MYCLFKYRDKYVHGEFLEPERAPKWGTRFPLVFREPGFAITFPETANFFRIESCTDLQITNGILSFTFCDFRINCKPEGDVPAILKDGKVYVEVTYLHPKTYNVEHISELQVSASDLKEECDRLQSELVSNRVDEPVRLEESSS